MAVDTLMPNVPLIDLRAQYRSIKPDIDEAIQRTLDRGQFVLGPELEALEREIAAYCGTAYAVGVASGTDALELLLRTYGIGRGDEVITTAYSFFATAEAIIAVGAVPVFVDIELATYNLDWQQLASNITPRTKAIIPVHLFGHPCSMDRVMELAASHHLKVIEDFAQAIGARFKGARVGSLGHAGAVSFFPSKNLGGYGDGGMVVTNDQAVAEEVRLLRVHGSREKYHHLKVGRNSRLDELQAAILRVKLRHLDAWNDRRRRHAMAYRELSRRYKLDHVILPQELNGCEPVYHLYSIRSQARDQLRRALTEQGVATQICYPSPLPAQPALKTYLPKPQDYPKAEEASRTILSLPMYPELTDELLEHIVQAVVRALRRV